MVSLVLLSLLLAGCSASHASPYAKPPLRDRVCASWVMVESNLSTLADGPPLINDSTGEVNVADEPSARQIVGQAKQIEQQARGLVTTPAGFGMVLAASDVASELSQWLKNPGVFVDLAQFQTTDPNYVWADGYCTAVTGDGGRFG